MSGVWLRRDCLKLAGAWALGHGLTACDGSSGSGLGLSVHEPMAALGAAADRARWIGPAPGPVHERLKGLGAGFGSGPGPVPVPGTVRPAKAQVLVVGGGVAGLTCARELVLAGMQDVVVLEGDVVAGGNSRAHEMGGLLCPAGAHYLPVPGPHAHEVRDLLASLGVCRQVMGRTVYNEEMLCHSPQERLHVEGVWVEGLLPPPDALPRQQQAATLSDYQRFASLVSQYRATGAFTLPRGEGPGLSPAKGQLTDPRLALDSITMKAWLDQQGLNTPALRWFLDYACRDDYGAGLAQVSAWAGLHYFASRHGFRAPVAHEEVRAGADNESEAVLTWPQGNAWLTQQMAFALGERVKTGVWVTSVSQMRGSVRVDAWHADGPMAWQARHVVMATPLHVTQRVLREADQGLRSALGAVTQRLVHAPWLVSNLLLSAPLQDRGGAPPSWDNVNYGSPMLGYVDASHQTRRAHREGPQVLTHYWALGGSSESEARQNRLALRDATPATWAKTILEDLTAMHPELPERLQGMDLMRWGHAMAVPVPGMLASQALVTLAKPHDRLFLAHSDLSGYAVFEEAHAQGLRAARQLLGRVRRGMA